MPVPISRIRALAAAFRENARRLQDLGADPFAPTWLRAAEMADDVIRGLDEDRLTIAQAAAEPGVEVDESTLRRMVKRGDLADVSVEGEPTMVLRAALPTGPLAVNSFASAQSSVQVARAVAPRKRSA